MKLTLTLTIEREPVPARIQRRIKNSIRLFFDGLDSECEPVVNIPTIKLGITNINFKRKSEKKVEVEVTLERPGLMIGKAGSTIDALTKYVSCLDYEVEFKLVEARIWN